MVLISFRVGAHEVCYPSVGAAPAAMAMGASLDADGEPPADVAAEPCRVHDMIVSGNVRTRDHVFERHLREAREARTVQQLDRALERAQGALEVLDVFDKVEIVVDVGPPELPGTANVFVVVQENTGRSATVGAYNHVRARPRSAGCASCFCFGSCGCLLFSTLFLAAT